MKPHEAKLIISLLAKGIDPISGEKLLSHDVLNAPEIIRALYLALEALESHGASYQKTQVQLSKAGLPWSDDEDRKLLKEFDDGTSEKEIALQHERTIGAIHSRLKKLGRIDIPTISDDDMEDLKSTKKFQIQDKKLKVEVQKVVVKNFEKSLLQLLDSAENQYYLYEQLQTHRQNIRSFLIQIVEPKKANDVWIFGDGESWGKLIEYNDAVKANKDAVNRIVEILCKWIRECSEIMSDGSFNKLVLEFEIRLKSNPNDISHLFKILYKQSNKELIENLHKFIGCKISS
jgi:hypothetical protein